MFPIKEAFDKEMEKIEAKVIPWRDMKVDEIYRIEEKREVPNGNFGRVFIMRVSKADGNSIQVWAPQLISKRLMLVGKEEMKLPCFIRLRGLKVCKTDANRSYQTFQLLSAEVLRMLLNR